MRFKSKDILLVGLKGEKGEKGEKGDSGIITVDTELSRESENLVQNKVITEAVDGCVKQSTLNTGKLLYCRANGNEVMVGVTRLSLEWLNQNANGLIPEYAWRSGVNRSVLLTGTPQEDIDCANKKYVDDNKGTKLYKHIVSYDYTEDNGTFTNTITFYSTSGNVESYSIVEEGGWVYIENIDNIVSIPRYISDQFYGLMELELARENGYAFVIKSNSDITISNIQKAVE